MMDDDRKSREELLAELNAARDRVRSLERNGERLRKVYRERIRERRLFANGPVTLFKWRNEPGWPVEYIGKNVWDLLGYPRRRFLDGNLAHADVIHPDDRDRVTGEVAANDRPDVNAFIHRPYRLIRADGAAIWVSDHTLILRDADGKTTHYVGYLMDITRQVTAEAGLFRSRESLALAQRMARIGNWEWTMATGEILWSDEVYRIFGVDRNSFDLTYERYLGLLHPDDRDFLVARVHMALETGGDYEVEHRIIRADGEIRFIHGIGQATRAADGQPTGLMGTVQDVTEKVMAKRELQHRESMLRAMSEASHDALIMIDANDRVLFWNPAAERMFGYSREEALRGHLHEMITLDEEREAAYRGLRDFALTGRGAVLDRVMEFQARRANGEFFPVERAVAAFQVEGEWYAVGVVRDISERKTAEARLREMATTDELTGIGNRRHFRELAERQLTVARRYLKPFSLVLFDVDRFKLINDTHGHDGGDRVLRALADTARRLLRKADFVGRLGGEEFAFCLPETDQPQAEAVAERFRREVASLAVPMDTGGVARFTVSLGIACLDTPDETLDTLLKRADQALYRAKEEGRNRVVVG